MPDAKKIEELFTQCLANDDTAEPLVIEGIVHNTAFDPEKVRRREAEIVEQLKDLPDQFYANKGGGWSFLNLCNDSSGTQWTGFHLTMEQLCLLAMAVKRAKFCLPREIWKALPGGMPYIQFSLQPLQ